MIIDSSYLTGGKYRLPNNVSNSSITGNAPTSSNVVDSYIAKYEEQLLLNALGYANYQALKTVVEADQLGDAGNEKWNDLVTGKVYTYESNQVEWKGLRRQFGTIKDSLIAKYVYYHYLQDDVQNYTTTGVQREKSKNAVEQTPSFKLTQAWREFIQEYQYGYDTCPVRISNSAGITGVDWYASQQNSDRSLYQFLRDNDDYGEYKFTIYDNINQFGI